MEKEIYYDYKMIQKEIEIYNKEAPKIQEKFDFEIPDYILHEIITNSVNKDNIICLINMAILNNRISSENATILKKYVIEEL